MQTMNPIRVPTYIGSDIYKATCARVIPHMFSHIYKQEHTGEVILLWSDNVLILGLHTITTSLPISSGQMQTVITKCSQSNCWFSLSRECKIFCSSNDMVVSPSCWLRSCAIPGLCVWPVSTAATKALSCGGPSACPLARCNWVAVKPERQGKATAAFLPDSTSLFVKLCCYLLKYLNSVLLFTVRMTEHSADY